VKRSLPLKARVGDPALNLKTEDVVLALSVQQWRNDDNPGKIEDISHPSGFVTLRSSYFFRRIASVYTDKTNVAYMPPPTMLNL